MNMKKWLTLLAVFAMLLVSLACAESASGEGAERFAGRWGCGRATIDIFSAEDGTFDVTVTWSSSAWEQGEWRYRCAYDSETGQLKSDAYGTMADVTYSGDGDVASSVIVYTDGQATFAIDADGMLIWNDLKENAAEGMRFERGVIL